MFLKQLHKPQLLIFGFRVFVVASTFPTKFEFSSFPFSLVLFPVSLSSHASLLLSERFLSRGVIRSTCRSDTCMLQGAAPAGDQGEQPVTGVPTRIVRCTLHLFLVGWYHRACTPHTAYISSRTTGLFHAREQGSQHHWFCRQ